MANQVYECMFIFDSNRYARNANGVTAKIGEMVENIGGELLASRLWVEQKLAYPIKKQKKGTYWLTYFRADGTKLGEFERACQLNDDILRQLTLKVDPRLADALVAHARGEAVPEDVEAEGAEEAAADAPAEEEAAATEE